MSSLIGAGAIATVATTQGAGYETAIAALLQTLANVGGNIVATDLYEVVAKRLNHVEILHNRDLARAVGHAISTLIRSEASDPQNASDKGALIKMSATSPGTWELLAAFQDESLTQISEANLPRFFSTKAEEFDTLTALDQATWRHLLRWLARQEDVYISDEAYDRVAEKLYKAFPKALREILKHDFANKGEAYGGLLLALVGEINASQDELLAETQRILVKTEALQHEGRAQNTQVVALLKQIITLLTQMSVAHPPPPTVVRWHLPLQNLFFTGREKVLDKLRDELKKNGRVALSGTPGVGKTQTVIEYAYRYGEDYKYVFFVRAETNEDLILGFASIARPLNLPLMNDPDQNKVAESVKVWLETQAGWLLIFDNIYDLPRVRSYIPSNKQGHVLLATRAQQAGGIAELVKLDKMNREEGARLLLRRAGLLTSEDPLEKARSEDLQAAREIASEVDGLPLAINIAGAFIQNLTTPAEYLLLYRQEGKRLRQERDLLGTHDHDSVATTFSLAFKQIIKPDDETERGATIARAAADLIRFCAFVAPDNIPDELLSDGATELGESLSLTTEDALLRLKVIEKACRFSLLDRAPKSLSAHRLVQTVVRDEMDEATQRLWIERTLLSLAKVFPLPEFPNWAVCDRLLPHAQTCLNYVSEIKLETLEVARLTHRVAELLRDHMQYAEAEPIFQRALAICENLLGTENLVVARMLNDLGNLYQGQGRYDEAEVMLKRALLISGRRALGVEYPDPNIKQFAADLVAVTTNNLAQLYNTQGRYEEAERLFQRALDIYVSTLGIGHPEVGTVLNNLAQLYTAQGRYDEAVILYKGALENREKILGIAHPEVAMILDNLAEAYRAQGRYDEAEPLYERALTIGETTLGAEHPEVATVLNNLAALYVAQTRYAEAAPLYKRALMINEKVFGADHPNVATILNNIAALYSVQRLYAEAETLCQRALSIRAQVFGAEHPLVAAIVADLAILHYSQGHYAKAELWYKSALEMREKVLGAGHPEVAMTLNGLALLYNEQKRYAEAELLWRRALTTYENVLSAEHPHLVSNQVNLANLYMAQGRYEEAKPLYARAHEIATKTWGENHIYTVIARNKLSQALEQLEK